MGTDIHAKFHKKVTEGDVVQWEEVESTWEQNRHYMLFAALANVRNGFGFAGIDTGDAIPYISEPRGLPDDVDARETDDNYWYGDHSFSWLTADEMLEWFDNGISHTKKTGVVMRSWYEAWDSATGPECYSGWTSGPNVLVLEQDSFDAIVAIKHAIATQSGGNSESFDIVLKDKLIRDHLTESLSDKLNERWLTDKNLTLPQAIAMLDARCTHVQISWTANFKEELSYFFDEVKRLKELHGDVRMVFGFDS